jgi:hypothetical protein
MQIQSENRDGVAEDIRQPLNPLGEKECIRQVLALAFAVYSYRQLIAPQQPSPASHAPETLD